jgi:BirA family transcriptional regulator, biotin operon repressor / biotin---[acetyl-CoA-carboxylase] ligase
VARCVDRQRRKGAVLTIFRVAETGSTNADLLDMAWRGDAVEGDWLVAERQTAGRGRQGRAWVSPPGNLYASALFTLRPTDPPAPTLALAVGIGLVTAVCDPAYLKWPNDLMIRDAKVAGTLLERQGDSIVVGFGINLVSSPSIEGRKTTYLGIDGNIGYDCEEMLSALAEWIPWAVQLWRENGAAYIAARWQSEAHPHGTRLPRRSLAALESRGGSMA